MNACPNIAGREIKRRITFGYIGLIMTLLVIGYVLFFESNIYLHVLIFLLPCLWLFPFLKLKVKHV